MRMPYFQLTLFNSITLFIMALTVLAAVIRFTSGTDTNRVLICDSVLLGYTLAFRYGLNTYVVLASIGCAVLIRFGMFGSALRWVELVLFAAIVWRCIGLILLW